MEPTRPIYATRLGRAFQGDCREILQSIPSGSVSLCCTSPPFPLRRKKAYGNVTAEEYPDWIMPIAKEIYRVLRPEGSLVLELGGAWNSDGSRSLMNYALVVKFGGLFHLADEFVWTNPRALPAPAEWVCKQRVRCKDAVTHLYWFSKTRHPQADNRCVVIPYVRPAGTFRNGTHPSGHKLVAETWQADNGGAIPPNFFTVPGVACDDYMRRCQAADQVVHPARQPPELPDFFIRFLTRPNQLVLDPFAGSNTTGQVAEGLGRRWVSIEILPEYVEASRLRFQLPSAVRRSAVTGPGRVPPAG
jgi:site-specific DNA-methyltransferase (cytosine-N4-specific)